MGHAVFRHLRSRSLQWTTTEITKQETPAPTLFWTYQLRTCAPVHPPRGANLLCLPSELPRSMSANHSIVLPQAAMEAARGQASKELCWSITRSFWLTNTPSQKASTLQLISAWWTGPLESTNEMPSSTKTRSETRSAITRLTLKNASSNSDRPKRKRLSKSK